MSSASELHTEIANVILRDLGDRRGIGDALDECDADVRKEIRDAIAEIITRGLSRVKKNQ
jgi:hypothetical protein